MNQSSEFGDQRSEIEELLLTYVLPGETKLTALARERQGLPSIEKK